MIFKTKTKHSLKGTIRSMTALHTPIGAFSKDGGRPVRIVALGDVHGFSPACWVIDQNGDVSLEPTENFRVIDTAFLPPSRQVLTNLAGTLESGKF